MGKCGSRKWEVEVGSEVGSGKWEVSEGGRLASLLSFRTSILHTSTSRFLLQLPHFRLPTSDFRLTARGFPMPQEFLRDVLRTGDTAARRQRHWSVLPLSIAGHAVVVTVLLLSPLASSIDLPMIASPLADFIETVAPTPPPPPSPAAPGPTVAPAKAPITAPHRRLARTARYRRQMRRTARSPTGPPSKAVRGFLVRSGRRRP